MFESTLANVIAIDTEGETIHFYSSEKGSQKNIHHEAQSYRARPFDDEFFEKLGHILKLHCERNPGEQLQKVSLILPDQAFFTDNINIPTITHKYNPGINIHEPGTQTLILYHV